MNDKITQAVRLIQSGGVVCFPTETVYAMAADATNKTAIDRIYKIKGRDFKKPLALLIKDVTNAKELVEYDERFLKLAAKFCPGPITFILPLKTSSASIYNNLGLSSVAIRIPDNEIALKILGEVNCPIVATSVNPSGQPEAISAQQVHDYFASQVDLIIDGGSSEIGIASTIIDLSGTDSRILRLGAVTKEMIEEIIGSVE